MINKIMKKRGEVFILALFLSLLYFPLTFADSGDSCSNCGKGLIDFCTQNRCEKIAGCSFVEGDFLKNLGSCIQTQFSPSGMITREISKSIVGVDCPVDVTLNVNTLLNSDNQRAKFYVIEESLPKVGDINGWSVSNAGI